MLWFHHTCSYEIKRISWICPTLTANRTRLYQLQALKLYNKVKEFLRSEVINQSSSSSRQKLNKFSSHFIQRYWLILFRFLKDILQYTIVKSVFYSTVLRMLQKQGELICFISQQTQAPTTKTGNSRSITRNQKVSLILSLQYLDLWTLQEEISCFQISVQLK